MLANMIHNAVMRGSGYCSRTKTSLQLKLQSVAVSGLEVAEGQHQGWSLSTYHYDRHPQKVVSKPRITKGRRARTVLEMKPSKPEPRSELIVYSKPSQRQDQQLAAISPSGSRRPREEPKVQQAAAVPSVSHAECSRKYEAR